MGNQLRENLGIEFTLQGNLDFAEYLPLGDAKGFTGPFRLGWSMDYPSPQNYLEPLYTTAALAAGRLELRLLLQPGVRRAGRQGQRGR